MQQLAVPRSATPTIRSRRVPAVSRLIGRFHTSGCVRLITLPSWSSSASTTNGFIISPSLATVAATIAMWSGTIWSSFWPKPRIASSGRLSSMSVKSPTVLAAAPGRSIGIVLADAPALRCPPRTARARARARSGRTACCTSGRTPWRSRRRRCVPLVVLDRVVGLRRQELALVGEDAVERDDAVVEGDAGGQHLERRARHVALLVGVGEQRVARVGLQLGEVGVGVVVVDVGDQVGVVARVAPHRLDRAGLRLHQHDRALAVAEQELGDRSGGRCAA